MRRALCTLAALALFLSLAACGGGNMGAGSGPLPAERPSSPLSETGQWNGLGGCYKRISLFEGEVRDICARGDDAFMLSFEGEVLDADGALIYSGETLSLAEGRDCLWITEAVWAQSPAEPSPDAEERGEYEIDREIRLVKLSPGGEVLLTLEAPEYCSGLAADGAGNLYLGSAERVCVYSPEGEPLGQFPYPEKGFQPRLLSGGDGAVWLSGWEGGRFVARLGPSGLEEGPWEQPQGAEMLCGGPAGTTLMYSDGRALMGWEPRSGKTETLLVWSECGISSVCDRLLPCGDGFLRRDAGGVGLIRPAEPGEIRPRTVLTLCMPYSGLISAAEFNALSQDYYVECVDYGGGSMDIGAALTRLNTELIAGGGPDMILFSDLPPEKYAQQGALLNLYPYLSSDPYISAEDFYCLAALDMDGALYSVASGFAINSFYGLPESVGEGYGWSFDDYFAVEAALPQGAAMLGYVTGAMFLEESMSSYIPSAIDWRTGSCRFDCPEFTRLLEAAKSVYDPKTPDENPMLISESNELFASGGTILNMCHIRSPEDYLRPFKTFGRDVSYIGWPTADGGCGSAFSLFNEIGICSRTSSPEGCWAFIRYLLTGSVEGEPVPRDYSGDLYVQRSGFPSYKPWLEELIRACTSDLWAGKNVEIKNGNQVWADGYYLGTTEWLDPAEGAPMSAARAGSFYELLSAISSVRRRDQAVMEIITDEAAAYFQGVRSAGEAAKNIQARVSIYVAEQT